MAKENTDLVVAAANQVVAHGLAANDSIFTPGTPIWTAANAAELVTAYVDRPDLSGLEFMPKLQGQLTGTSDGAKQLFAELFAVNLLPLSDYYGNTKRELISKVLSWCTDPPALPPEFDAGLDGGVFNGGVAFKTRRWAQLSFLVQFVGYWKALPAADRAGALADPWAFREVVLASPGPPEPSQRTSLLYVAFPEIVVPIVSTPAKREIVRTFGARLESPTGNLDRDLASVRAALVAERGAPVDLYLSPWVEQWNPKKKAIPAEPGPDEADVIVRRAWLVRGSGVVGHNLVPVWLKRGSVSLAATQLPHLGADVDRDEIKAIVEEHYQHKTYAVRGGLAVEFDLFINVMQIGDVVVANSGGKVYVGEVAGDFEQVNSTDGRSNLRRAVEWRNAENPLAFGDLPAPLAAKMSSQSDVIDLTNEMAILLSLLDGSPDPVVKPVSGPLTLRPADGSLAAELLTDLAWLQEFIDLLADRKQVILYGPPGTGKTYVARHVARHLTEPHAVKLVQFHPSYAYEDFFEGFRPAPSADGTMRFERRPGPFRRIVDAARDNPSTPYVLIIDEINRANLAKVFGELYFLLEYRDDPISLLYSAGDEDDFTMPANVYVIGTMNTSDRSIALVDAAMRRRFGFVPLHPAQEPVRGLLGRWLAKQKYSDEPARLLAELNARIADYDYAIGPSYLMRDSVTSAAGLERIWRTSLMPLLEELHYGESIDLDMRYGLGALRKAIASVSQADDRPAEPVPGPPELPLSSTALFSQP